jgi:DNA-binding XRE family transcriptional regulator
MNTKLAFGSQEIALTGAVDIIFNTRVGRKLNMAKNSLKKIRESLLMSKSELAREANVSPITISRIEQGKPCRMETKRKILLALGYSLSDAKKIFNE